MTKSELFKILKDEFLKIIDENGLEAEGVSIRSTALTAEEAIGITERKDYPILAGSEIMLQAECNGSIGQAFTSAPAAFSGSLREVVEADIENDDHARALFIAALNAVMKSLGKADRTIHCRNNGPELCAKQYIPFLKETYGTPKILLVGYQPALFQNIAADFEMRILDLNPDNVGTEKYGVVVEHGIDDYEDAVAWADLIVCTGSTLSNGSIINYIDIGKDVVFFGTTLAGAAEILGLKRACFESE